jgi:DNA (cytosine-5)-methyltransferase 1
VKPFRYGSVCSGIEAATAAWHPLGWQPAFFSEIEAFPRAVLAHHYPAVPCHGDFTTIGADDYGAIDLLVGGTPCQSFSIAGLRGGLDDDRGNLALEYLRLADKKRPRWLVWENVPGVLSSNGGRDFGAILGGMVELGYGVAYRVLDAQHFGVPQRRRRVFVVGHLGDWRRAAAVLFERHSLQGHSPPRREKGEISPTIPSRSLGGGGLGADCDCDGGLICADVAPTLNAHFGDRQGLENQHIDGGGACLSPPLAMCLNAGAMGRQDVGSETLIPVNRCGFDDVAHALRGEGFDASEDGTGRGTPLVPVFSFPWQLGGSMQMTVSEEQSGALVKCQTQAVAFDLRGREGGAQFEGPHDTANIRAASGGSSRIYVATWAVRRLTPRECERLQGFPDDFTLVPHRGKPAADGPRYKALGNSMAVPVMRWIGERIAAVEALDL